MTSKAERTKFAELYHSLPQDAQQTLVESHLIPLLSRTSRKRAKRANAAASRLRRRHQNLPALDLKAKKAEINFLLDELARDSKRSLVMDISSKPEILNEIISSLTDWLSDLWSVAYEHNVQYQLVHECLLFVHDAINRLSNVRSCCQCSLANLFAPVTIKSKTGAVIRSFSIEGVNNLETVSEFIWREMFLSMLASGKERHEKQVSEMLDEIQQINGWTQLVRILRGGKKRPNNLDLDEGDEDEGEEDWDDVDEEDDDDDSMAWTWEDESFGRCRHWTTSFGWQLPRLHVRIVEAMKKHFEVTPSGRLYRAILDISLDYEQVSNELMTMAENVARVSADTLAVALEIYSLEMKVPPILALLRSHGHLLRPRDAPALQAAVLTLDRTNHTDIATSYIRRELTDTARAVLKALSLSFSRLDEPSNKSELSQIFKMRHNTTARRNRVESWVDSIMTPGADAAANPMMFAAMMMGVPPLPGMNADDDAYTYLDMDPLDPDLEDLRHEYRPALKKRFESWVNVAHMLKGGPTILLSVYKFLVDLMPFLRATDATEEIIGRLQDRPSKLFVCEGLDALLAFTKIQKRKWKAISAEIQKKKELDAQKQAQAASGSEPSTATAASAGGSNTATPSPAETSQTSDPASSTTTATPISGPVPVATMLSAFQSDSPSKGQASMSPSASSSNPTEGASKSAPDIPHGSASGEAQSSGLVQSFLTNPLAPSISAPGTQAIGLPYPLSAILGRLGQTSPPAGPSLDDVD